MKEERIEILKMVAEKKITVEEGERVLRALEKGQVEDLRLDGETTVVLTNPRTAYKHGSADVSIRPSEDNRLHLEAGEKGKCEVVRKENKIVIFCHNDAAVRVTPSIA